MLKGDYLLDDATATTASEICSDSDASSAGGNLVDDLFDTLDSLL